MIYCSVHCVSYLECRTARTDTGTVFDVRGVADEQQEKLYRFGPLLLCR